MLARFFKPWKVRHTWFTFIPTLKFLITSRLYYILAKKDVMQPTGSCDQYTVIWEKYKLFGLFWPSWPSRTKFFLRIQFYVIFGLQFKFDTILAACSREFCSQGHKLNWRLLAFEGRFSKNNSKFLTHFKLTFKIFPKTF